MSKMKTEYSKEEFYQAHLARDPRFDGKFFVAVKSTMIYCRPICPARKAKLKNLAFFIHVAEAEEAGYRPCLRCRPETAPGSAAWIGTSATVQRALRIMDRYAVDGLSIKDIAKKLGIGERWFRELFRNQVGASPQSVLVTKKLDIARKLLDSSSLSITDIAFSSGFQSIRRFNDAFKERFKKPPSAFKKELLIVNTFNLQLSYRPPYHWNNMMSFLNKRAVDGVELVEAKAYQRLISYDDIRGWMKVTFGQNNKVNIELKLNKNGNVLDFVARIKNMFDLDADPMAIEKTLMKAKVLADYIKQYNGLRIPGSWDGFELAVRAIVGQRISVKAARSILGKIVQVCGEQQMFDTSLKLSHYFPTPENIINADLSNVGLPAKRIDTLKDLAKEIIEENIVLDGTADYDQTRQTLLAIKGIGPWTVDYISMRALMNPDAFPEGDLGIQKKIKRLHLNPKIWKPWRAYGAILLWSIKS